MLVHRNMATTSGGVQPPAGAASMEVIQDDFDTAAGQPAEVPKVDSARRMEGSQRRSRSGSRSRWPSRSRHRSRGRRHRSRSRSGRRRRRSRYVVNHLSRFNLLKFPLDQLPAQAAQALQAVAAEARGHYLLNLRKWRSSATAAAGGRKTRRS